MQHSPPPGGKESAAQLGPTRPASNAAARHDGGHQQKSGTGRRPNHSAVG